MRRLLQVILIVYRAAVIYYIIGVLTEGYHMKKRIIFFMACLLLVACNQQEANVGFGLGISGYNSRFIKMDSHARQIIHDYLASAYKSNCPGKKAKQQTKSCTLNRPLMTNGSIPVGTEYQPLPQDIMNKIGFVPPGTDFVQIGYNVYLIHWPDKIIYDSVSLHPYWKESLRK